MVRHVVLGNQRLLVNLDESACIRDVYYPHVGQENHVLGERQRIGVYTDHLSWVHEDGWTRCLECDGDTLTSDATLEHPGMGVRLSMHSVVDQESDVLLRKISVANTSDTDRRITVFFYHNFFLYGDGIGDTAGYDPVRKSVFTYKRNRYFLWSCATPEELAAETCSVTSYMVGQEGNPSYKDAVDGLLGENPIAQGEVDSTFSKSLDVPAGDSRSFWYIMVVGKSFDDVHKLLDVVMSEDPEEMMVRDRKEQHAWMTRDLPDMADLSPELIDLYHRSLLVVRTQIDSDGGILAGNDSDNMHFNRDTYSYVWPRDGALVAMALDRAGKRELTQKYFTWCAGLLYEDGCFLHKYNPDGSLGSSWQAWIRHGEPHLPIQEDETGLQLHALWLHHERYKEDDELFDALYESFVIPAANFLESWWDDSIGLPRPSWTLWEDRININLWTCASAWAGLMAAAHFAHLKDDVREHAYLSRAADIHRGVEKHLFSDALGRFLNAVTLRDGKVVPDLSLESSMFGVLLFGMFSPDDTRVLKTVHDIEQGLWVPTMVGGLSRNEQDWFHYAGDAFKTVKGNPWVNTTCWLGKHRSLVAQTPDDLQGVRELLDWVRYRALNTGLLSEQFHPFTGAPLGVCPLTWSHAEYIDLVHYYLDAYRRVHGGKE